MSPVFVIVAVLVFVALLTIGEPLLRKRGVWLYGRRRSPLDALEQQRDELLRALKDLEIEHDAGRLDDEAYEKQRKPLFEGAVDLAGQIKQRRAEFRTAREAIEAELKDAAPESNATDEGATKRPEEATPARATKPETASEPTAAQADADADADAEPATKPEVKSTPAQPQSSADDAPDKPATKKKKKKKKRAPTAQPSEAADA